MHMHFPGWSSVVKSPKFATSHLEHNLDGDTQETFVLRFRDEWAIFLWNVCLQPDRHCVIVIAYSVLENKIWTQFHLNSFTKNHSKHVFLLHLWCFPLLKTEPVFLLLAMNPYDTSLQQQSLLNDNNQRQCCCNVPRRFQHEQLHSS